jgi:surfactin synthase thioesterase subunit/glycosyltransferase involved in cell wall biosynthesis
MRILLAHNSLYHPSFGGGDKSNRLLMEALAARGHDVRVVARIANFGEEEHAQFLAELEARGLTADVTQGAARFDLNGVDVRTLTLNPQLRAYFSEQVAEFDPDVILTSTDDPAQLLFDIARRATRARVVYLVRATIAVPFGPDSSSPNQAKTEMLRQADGIAGVSEYVAGYVRQWSGLEAIHVPISLLERREAHQLGRFDNPYVVMVNPCAVKGISIFLALADRAPQLEFAAVPTWGTSARDLAGLRRRPNIAVIDPVENLDDLFRQARVVLAPSLWAEARSRVVVEAMLRGVPVIASDTGGLKEAKLGVPYLLPVNPITHYQSTLDPNMVPVATVPEQDIGPWLMALERLTGDRVHWEEISAQSRAAALDYASTLTVEPFEKFLLQLLGRPKRRPDVAAQLSADKRKLLALRLKRRAWFPTLDTKSTGALQLFCCPHAGGGILAYRKWMGAIAGVEAVPVLLPGRETRLSEPPFEDMRELIDALTPVIRPLLGMPYAFFGHSMGSGIAFELARSLRRIGAPQPSILIVSGARAPQDRTEASRKGQPSDAELARELGDFTPEALDLAFPILRADTELYRNYVYQPEPPLAIPIAVYGGASDASVAPELLDRWREQTTGSFIRREFEGGHFYLTEDPERVLGALRLDLDCK